MPLGAHVRVVPAPDRFRSATGDLASEFASDVEHAIQDLARQGVSPAGIVFDTIFSSDGVLTDPAGFIAPAVAAVRRAGGVFIADEVQPGFGRVGEYMWGFQRHGVTPDLVTLGKPMSAHFDLSLRALANSGFN